MKRIFALLMLISLATTTTITGCGSSKNNSGVLGGAGRTVATAVGTVLLTKIIQNVLGKILGNNAFSALAANQQFKQSFGELTPISSFANNDLTRTALQLLVANHYEIPAGTVAKSFSSLKTVGDLATFIGQNGSAKALAPLK